MLEFSGFTSGSLPSIPHPDHPLWSALSPAMPTGRTATNLLSPPPQTARSALAEQAANSAKTVLAAGVSGLPGGRAMVKKTCYQLGETPPYMTWVQGVKAASKWTPLIGGMSAAQMLIQPQVERRFATYAHPDSAWPWFFSSAGTGILCAPGWAVVNGYMAGSPALKSLKNFDRWQFTALSGKEIVTIAALSGIDRLTGKKEDQSTVTRTSKVFATGAACAILTQPFDTWQIRSAKGKPITSARLLMAGWLHRAWAFGVFFVVYENAKQLLFSSKPRE